MLEGQQQGGRLGGGARRLAPLHRALSMALMALRMAGDALRLGLVSTPGLVVMFAQNLLSSWPDGDGMLLELLCRLLLLLSQQEGPAGGRPAAAESLGLKAAAMLQWALRPGDHVHGMQDMVWHLVMDSGMLPSLLEVCSYEPTGQCASAPPPAFRMVSCGPALCPASPWLQADCTHSLHVPLPPGLCSGQAPQPVALEGHRAPMPAALCGLPPRRHWPR